MAGSSESWDWVETGRELAATRWASSSARTSLRMTCKNAVKSAWAGGGAGGAGGCPAVIGTTCPGGVAVKLFRVAARVELRASACPCGSGSSSPLSTWHRGVVYS